ncbi:HEXXH motif-containing protein [Thermomonospora echinospora]|uniref:HEXXH motif-containing protein n=1 Tax=Thermomonospora echinospora TaxID=1992 RepID=A0A1H5XX07_9ACTN|nr:HEXXH motif domain-containing protein [Thermomonospora echinospora]SEG16329.1 HEXXH motif-containing protein [Thermomonospora echinospora]
MIGPLRIPASAFRSLAAGRGDAAAMEMLRRGQLSRHKLRLHALWGLVLERRRSLGSGLALIESGFELLSEVEGRRPAEVAEVLLYPHVTAWSAACLRGLVDQGTPQAEADLAHVCNIAVAAALRAGLDVDAEVAVRGGVAALPTLGCAQVGPDDFHGTAKVRSGSGGVEISTGHRTVVTSADPHADVPGWHGIRVLRCTHGRRTLRLPLDDVDPYRDDARLGPAPRLPETAVGAWQRALDGAWSILATRHQERADTMAAMLTALVPLATQGGRRGLSATSAEAFGAVAITPPGDALLFAESLVHEFQHVKLCALLDLVRLYDDDPRECFYSPWRDDPRPLGGLLQGAYAYLGVTEFWAGQREALSDGDAAFADYALALWRTRTLHTIDFLAGSDRLTEDGARFVAGMRAALLGLPQAPVGRLAGDLAAESFDDHVLTWRLRHLRPDPGALDRIAAAWPSGSAGPLTGPPRPAPVDQLPGMRGARFELRGLRLRDPSGFRSIGRDRWPGAGAEAADLALVRGDVGTALEGYRAHLAAGSSDPEAWAGLALAARRVGDEAAVALRTAPEVVAGAHGRIGERTGALPDPLDLARRLTPVIGHITQDWTVDHLALPRT